MDTVILISAVILYRFLLFILKNNLRDYSKNVVLVIMFVTIVFCAMPIVFLKKEIIESNVINILIAGFSFFYLPFVVGKIDKSKK